jgi:hypothetical protein
MTLTGKESCIVAVGIELHYPDLTDASLPGSFYCLEVEEVMFELWTTEAPKDRLTENNAARFVRLGEEIEYSNSVFQATDSDKNTIHIETLCIVLNFQFPLYARIPAKRVIIRFGDSIWKSNNGWII